MSLSPSPAFAPCGIPPPLDEVAGVAGVELELELEVVAGGVAAELLDDEDDDPPPHPASATTTVTHIVAINASLRFRLPLICSPPFRYCFQSYVVSGSDAMTAQFFRAGNGRRM